MFHRAEDTHGAISAITVWRMKSVMWGGRLCLVVAVLVAVAAVAWSEDSEVLRPRVPRDQIEPARAVANPLPATPETLQKGKALFRRKSLLSRMSWIGRKGIRDGSGLFHLQATLATEFYRQDIATGAYGW